MADTIVTDYFPSPEDRALILPGMRADSTYNFQIHAYRKVHPSISADGFLLSTAAAVATYKPEDMPVFGGDIMGTIQGRDSLVVVANLEAIASDNVLSTTEKPGLIINYNVLVARYDKFRAAATALTSMSAKVNAATTAKNALDTYLNGLSPAWSNTTVHTPIVKATFNNAWGAFYLALADLEASYASASAFLGYLTNESHTFPAASDGTVTAAALAAGGGTFYTIFKDQRLMSGVTYSIVSNTGCTVTINTSGQYFVTAMSADAGSAVLRAVYQGFTIEKTVSLAKSRAGTNGSNGTNGTNGTNGASAKIINLYATRPSVSVNASGAYEPASQSNAFIVEKINTTAAVTWSMTRLDGSAVTIDSARLTVSGDSATMTLTQFDNARQGQLGVIVKATVTDGVTLTDTVSVVRVANGTNGSNGAPGSDGAPAIGFVSDSNPGSGQFVSQMWYSPTTKILARWSGSAWIKVLGDLSNIDIVGSINIGNNAVQYANQSYIGTSMIFATSETFAIFTGLTSFPIQGSKALLKLDFLYELSKTNPTLNAEYSFTVQGVVYRPANNTYYYSPDKITVVDRWIQPSLSGTGNLGKKSGHWEFPFTGLPNGTYNIGYEVQVGSHTLGIHGKQYLRFEDMRGGIT